MRRAWFGWALLLLVGCQPDDERPLLVDAGAATAGDGACAPSPNNAPANLECTGLYSDLVQKQVAPEVRSFAPAAALWSDGAAKQRWIQLPPGAQIDTSRPTEWVFPVGTKVWKEFKHLDKRIETRFFHKISSVSWQTATYLWNAGETATERASSNGVDVPVPDGSYHVPSTDECEQCHRGSKDRLLGFQSVLLGLPGAQGITLADLQAEGKLSQPPPATTYAIADDGTGLADPALRWLHVNCGVSCHNENENAQGYISRMFLRLDPAGLTSAPPRSWRPLMTTIDVPVYTANFPGRTRIVAGDPERSLVVELSSRRGFQQMPPIATKRIDEPGLELLREWVRRLGGDAGVIDGGVDAGPDAALADGSQADAASAEDAALPEDAAVAEDAALAEDAAIEDAAIDDAAIEDAAVEDAAIDDAAIEDAGVDMLDAEVPLPP